ncbi:gephyrin-like molybdotransferase Glp [Arenimonas fontis]|uniref:Molybdopterin molybdenumtransferase n=1 Tax=Arenimonas fontis TaxID=2608255 RepID=A0A5B2ZD19_9GAMM|nr:gephyrin-like molybdotransferase Glp [Arenimonas fontis]KAA2285969.1 molybdopterin molybdotransferase MoeA [Arenimonas fontis]
MKPPFPAPIDFAQALAILLRVAEERRLAAERVPLQRAFGRVMAADLVAGSSLPAFDNAAMDGFAVCGLPVPAQGWALVGEQFAGADRGLRLQPGQCVRITTGAPVPMGTEAVLIKENAREQDGRVLTDAGPSPGANIRRAGEDLRPGQRVLSAGQVLTPARIGLAAALGEAELEVARRPTVAIFTTGDELRPPGQALAPGELHDSNRPLLQALLQAEGLEPVAWPSLPDEPAVLAAALADAAAAFDLVVTCGGVSAGEKDHLPALLLEHGRMHFWKVRMKPGMPVLLGGWNRALVLGLPGNPVSVLATFITLGRPLLDALQGRAEPRPAWTALLAAPVSKRHGRREFLRGRLRTDGRGRLLVEPDPVTGSHRLAAAAHADVLIDLPEGEGEFPEGASVPCLPCAPGRG